MYRIASTLLFLFFANVSWALEIDLRHSEAVSYLHFLNTGFGEPFTSGSIKEIIEKSKSHIFQNKKLRGDFEQFKSFVQNGYNYADEVQNRPEGFWAEDALIATAVNSKSLEDFEKQLSIFVPYRGITSYHTVKKKAYPLFKRLIWEPTLAEQKSQIDKTNLLLKKTEFLKMLSQAKHFYRSDYPESLPFKVGLIPIPGQNLKNKHTSATNLRDVQMVPYFVSEGVKDSLDVIFHEFCHALYEGQSSKVKKEINAFYLNNNDPHALFVYRYLNEALATAWGNGWYSEVLNGELSSKSWYTVKYIDQLGKAYLPLIKEYVQKKKGMDKSFMRKTVEIAKSIFPNGPHEIAPNLMVVKLLIDHSSADSRKLKSELKQNFRIQSFNTSSPMRDQDLAELSENPLKTGIVITSDWKASEPRIKKAFDVSKITEKMNGQKSFWAILPRKGTYFFWINVENEKELSKLITKIKTLKELPRSPTVIAL